MTVDALPPPARVEPVPTLLARRPRRLSEQRIHDLTASILAVGALAVVSVLALRGSESALGALIGILSAATGYLMRGRIDPPQAG